MEIELPALVYQGIHLFNQGQFFAAHEALETAWRAEPGKIRELYQGILQVGVACYHIQRKNYDGANNLVVRALERLMQFSGLPLPFDLDKLIKDSQNLKQTVERYQRNPALHYESPAFPQIVIWDLKENF
jgi:uncharacterized protein